MIHAAERAKQRYGLELDGLSLSRISHAIKAGKSILLGKEPGAERHLVDHNGTALIVVVSPRGWIKTVLPRAHRFPRRDG